MHPLVFLIPGALIGWFLLSKNKAATAAAAAATPAAKASLPYSVPSAASNPSTLAVQQMLNHLGATPPLVEDGIYGPKTHDAISAFQTHAGLPATGTVDAATQAAINSASTAVSTSAAPSGYLANEMAPNDLQAYTGDSWLSSDENQ